MRLFQTVRRKPARRTRSLVLEQLEDRLVPAYTGLGSGLAADYFSDANLTNLAATRIDPTVDFNWGKSAPAAGLPSSGYSVRWTGQVQAETTDTYTFGVTANAGVRLWVNGQEIINQWGAAASTWTGSVALVTGQTAAIRLEYADVSGSANVRLTWSATNISGDIPASQLYGSGGWLDTDLGGNVGSLTSSGSTYTVAGAGALGGATDQGHFGYQSITGDASVTAQLGATNGTGVSAGVMIRGSTSSSAPFAALIVSSGQVELESRSSVGASILTSAPVAVGANPYLQLAQEGSLLDGYVSITGAAGSWQLVGSATVALNATNVAGLYTGSSSTVVAATAAFSSVTAAARVPLGSNVDGVDYWSLANVFVDMTKQATFTDTGFSGNPLTGTAVNTNGWPTQDFIAILQSGVPSEASIYNGTYSLSFTGKASLSLNNGNGQSNGTISNVVYNSATNTTTANVTLNQSSSGSAAWYFAIAFTGTTGGVQNIKCIRPGYAANTTQVFTNQFLATVAGFSTIRTMALENTNSNPGVTWAKRAQLTDATQSTDNGVAWEYIIQLANTVDQDVWINVPYGANSNYITQLATLFKNELNPNLKVYVEWANEVWNTAGGFWGNQNLSDTLAEVNAGGSNLVLPGETAANNEYDWADRRIIRQDYVISTIFESVYGASGLGARYCPIMATQFDNTYLGLDQMTWFDETYGNPSQYFSAIAVAPYIACGADTTSSQILADLTAAIQPGTDFDFNLTAYATLAAANGLPLVAYEGGFDTTAATSSAAEAAGNNPSSEALVDQYLNAWYTHGGGLFNWFESSPLYPYSWGLTDSITNLNSPRELGVRDVEQAPRVYASTSNGTAIPGPLSAVNFGNYWTDPTPDPYLRFASPGTPYYYLINAPQAGTYQLSMQYAEENTGDQVQLIINNSIVETLNLPVTGTSLDSQGAPDTFASSAPVTVQLPAGLSALQLNVLSGYPTVETFNFTAGTAASPPTVRTPAAASPSTVTGTTTALTVLGADAAGESTLTYTWAATSAPAGANPTFSSNGTNASKNTVVTFNMAGTYTFQVTITDANNLTVTSGVTVVVTQALTRITVAPATGTVVENATQQFLGTALDQFGAALTSQPGFTWSLTPGGVGGSVNASGLYTAPSSASGTATVQAAIGAVTGTATVTVQPATLGIFTTDLDIGSPGQAGSASYTASTATYTVRGGGADIWGTSDQFNYLYTSFPGNGTIVARVAAQQNTYSWAKAGVMFRDSTAANGSFVFLATTPGNGTDFFYRNGDGAVAIRSGQISATAPEWIKLVRSGNTFTGFTSPNGSNWTLIGSASIALGTTVDVGLAVTAHNNAAISAVTFTNVSVNTMAINAGGGASGAYAADSGFSGGTTSQTTDTIDVSQVASPAPQSVYQSERYGNFTYTASNLIPGATYDVRLDFAEIYWNAAGERLFDVSINSQEVLSDFDIFAAAGGKDKAIERDFIVTANSTGRIVIAFTSVVNYAKLSGIVITPVPL